jgi:malonyl CoA-acyl carrier protein transacylase
MIEQYVQFLDANKSVDLRGLSWTLLTKRTMLPVRTSFVALTASELSEKMKAELERKRSSGEDIGVRAGGEVKADPVILGVFTGQGAQWATMGRDLILGSATFSATIEKLEKSLKALPDPPEWSLKAELMAPPGQSRLSEAAISQPLCTAIQVALVDVLRCAGITFRATVGHSSGEIAAAYAAGVISAEEGIRIAYYRGVHAHLAKSASGARGAMLAAGMSLEEAQALIDLPQFKGRVAVAASNSPASVTLSGDADAIEEARQTLVGQKKFARALQVDTAYHSHHMFPCAKPYISSLKACNISPQEEDPSCSWISSVYGSRGTPGRQELTAQYWSDNMTGRVNFSQALERAVIEAGPFDAVVEVGPHPALKGPATQTLKESGENAPYTGVLDRKSNDMIALTNALAFLWCRLGTFFNVKGYEEAHSGTSLSRPVPLKDLPTYPWDHTQPYWTESRLSKEWRTRSFPPHELLGHMSPGSPENELKWRNILRREEVPWLPDHKIQGQVLLPAGAFCAMMLDAALAFIGDRTVSLLELLDVELHLPVAIPESSRGIELVTSIKQLDPYQGKGGDGQSVLEAVFTLSTGMPDGSTPLQVAVTSRVRVALGTTTVDALPRKAHSDDVAHLKPVDVSHFYSALRDVGLSYENDFSVLNEAERGWGYASAIVPAPSGDDRSVLSVRPSWMESCIQLGYLAFAYPGDGNLWTTFIPQRIGRLSFTPVFQKSEEYGRGTVLGISSRIVDTHSFRGKQLPSFTADIEVCDPATSYTWMQIENVVFSSLSHTLERDDRELFFSTVWKSDALDNHSVAETIRETPDAAHIHQLLDRTALAYLRELKGKGTFRAVPGDYQPLAQFVQRLCNTKNASLTTQANRREIERCSEESPEAVDLHFMGTLSESLQRRLLSTGDVETATLSIPSLVETVPALAAVDKHLGSITQTLKHRFPQLQVLEIGSDYFGPSGSVLAALEDVSGSYVFGNISPTSGAAGTLDQRIQEVKLESLQQDHLDKLRGLSQEGFDLMIISFLVHGRQNKDSIISDLRGLVKPGGYVLFVEPTRELTWLRYMLYATQTAHGDRALGSPVPLLELDNVLRSSMFSGIDHVADYSGISVMVSQALDDRIAALRHPLHPDHMAKLSGDLLFIGDGNLTTYRTIQDTVRLLHGWKGSLVVEQSLDTLSESMHNFSRNFSAVVILNDLKVPHSFQSTSHHKHLEKIQSLLEWTKNILWVALDGDFNDPIHAATMASSRSIASQIQDARFQSVLISENWNVEHTIASSLVRSVYIQNWKPSKGTHLWTDEDEIMIKDHQMFVPRVLPAREPNNRFNASRRNIIEEASDAGKDVVIDLIGTIDALDCYPSAKSHAFNIDKHSNAKVQVQVNYSSLMALRVGLHDYLHISIGQVPGQEGSVVAFSETLSNSIMVDRAWQIPCESDESMQRRVIEISMQYFAASWINRMFEIGTAIIYEPGKLLAYVLSELVRGTNKRFVFLTSDQDQVSGTGAGWIFVHPHSSRSALQSLVPRDTNLFVNMGPAKTQTAQRIAEIVGPTSSVEKDTLFRVQSRVASCEPGTSFVNTLKLARHFVSEIRKGFPEETGSLLEASKLNGRLPESTDPLAIVDWADADKIPLQARPLDSNTLLTHNKTYLLANIYIAFAEPLARWLVSGGARHIVIAER